MDTGRPSLRPGEKRNPDPLAAFPLRKPFREAACGAEKEVAQTLLTLLAERAGHHTRSVRVDPNWDGPLVGEPFSHQLLSMMSYLDAEGDIEVPPKDHPDDIYYPNHCVITPWGWRKYEERRRRRSSSDTVDGPNATADVSGSQDQDTSQISKSPLRRQSQGDEEDFTASDRPAKDPPVKTKKPGRPPIPEERKRKALEAKSQGKSNKQCAQIIYDAPYPTAQQVKNVYSILRYYKKSHLQEN